jgi:hypothetical protein
MFASLVPLLVRVNSEVKKELLRPEAERIIGTKKVAGT